MRAIAGDLDVNITWFFGASGDNARQDYIVRRAERRELQFESGITDYLLSQRGDSELELLWCRFEPGSTSGDEPYSHNGEEAGVVVCG